MQGKTSNRTGDFAVTPKHTKTIFCQFFTLILLTLFITVNHKINLSYVNEFGKIYFSFN